MRAEVMCNLTLLRIDVRIFSFSRRLGIRSLGVPSASFSSLTKFLQSRMCLNMAFSSLRLSW